MKTICGRHNSAGFTLVEIMIVVAILGLLVSISIPIFLRARQSAEATRIAKELKLFGDAFEMYYARTGTFPLDSHGVLPADMNDYINSDVWARSVWGGNYNWEGPSWGEGGPYNYAGISINGTTATPSQLNSLDAVLDNGDLMTGLFRQTPNGRYTYIIAE